MVRRADAVCSGALGVLACGGGGGAFTGTVGGGTTTGPGWTGAGALAGGALTGGMACLAAAASSLACG